MPLVLPLVEKIKNISGRDLLFNDKVKRIGKSKLVAEYSMKQIGRLVARGYKKKTKE